ncbi:hypothetical protein SORBI_3001G123650 [Sorghum bicolor]|uniref:Embryo surrounding factor 1 brassicaceae domain-containing protein n=1 Tax=Sorghum bicolor TaxID=4558 RepID=A0A1Z5S5Q0_SORBI|nr:hypothetical protein SORBI_3001G123650 [Sorghum bicolor]
MVGVMAISLVVIMLHHAPVAQCRYQLQQTSLTITSDNSTSVDFTTTLHENKVVLIFCHATKCGSLSKLVDCYCCTMKKGVEEVCYDTMEICRANCPVCNPKCPPP